MSTNENEGKTGFFSNIKNDLPASMVVFLVAMPLCLGIALASGAPPLSGIIAGIVGGIIVGSLSGSPLGVSGPAAGLAVIVLTAIKDLGGIANFDVFLLAVVLAGIIQVFFSIARAGVIGYYFPSSVIKGMLAGIGVIIILKQIPHVFGDDKVFEGDWAFFQKDGQTTLSELSSMFDSIAPGAMIIAAISLAILILWERPFMKRIGLFKIIQGPLVAVVSGIALNQLFVGSANLQLAQDHLVDLPAASTIGGFFSQFQTPRFSAILNPDIYLIAVTMAVVASLETLLCVEATDKLDPQKRITPTNRELMAQGVGNMVSGLIGGLPITQVIVRSSANIQSGGRTKASAIIHGIFLLICVMAIPKVLNMIPLASLAAILLMVGYKLAKPKLFVQMYKAGRSEYIPFFVTVGGIVFTDLLVGIGMGLAVAIIYILWNNYKLPYHFDPKAYEAGKPIRIQLSEDVSFLNKASLMNTLEQLPNGAHIILDAEKTRTIHPDALEIIENFRLTIDKRNQQLEILGMGETNLKDPVKEFGEIVLNHPNKGENPVSPMPN